MINLIRYSQELGQSCKGDLVVTISGFKEMWLHSVLAKTLALLRYLKFLYNPISWFYIIIFITSILYDLSLSYPSKMGASLRKYLDSWPVTLIVIISIDQHV